MIIVRNAKSGELEEARDLVCKCFGPNYFEAYTLSEIHKKLDPEFSNPESWILAIDSSKIVGVIRLVSRTILMEKTKILTGGVTSVCVHPKYRGQGVGGQMTSFSLQTMIDQRYVISLLFGRRAVDGFYGKFGYRSIGGYPSFEFAEELSPHHFSVHPFSVENLSMYIDAYTNTVQEIPIKIERSHVEWQILSSKLQMFDRYNFNELRQKDQFAGYWIESQGTIIELALKKEFQYNGIEILRGRKARINPSHPVFNFIKESTYKFETRFSRNGGQMARILREKELNDIFEGATTTVGSKIFLQMLTGAMPHLPIGTLPYISFAETDEF